MSIRQSLCNLLEQTKVTLQHSFKLQRKEWFAEVKIFKFSGQYHVDYAYQWISFDDPMEAVNFFGSLVFNDNNLMWFFQGVEKHKLLESCEEIEYMSEEEYEKLYKDYCDNYFLKDCPFCIEFDSEKAYELIKKIKAETLLDEEENNE